MSHFFYANRSQLVEQAIEGTIRTAPWHNLARLETDSLQPVVVRSDWDKSQVAVISGGGSGHEPLHLGFVGKGMLTAAICGDIFASPGVETILTAITALTGEAGCLLVVKNYTGDRLNFGLAAEKARAMGYRVEMLLVKDDIAITDNPQPRGLAGTLLVHKVAGYAASQGATLDQVLAQASATAQQLATIGVALSSCHLPGVAQEERVAAGCCELGMGIHGEPGAMTLATQNSQQIVAQLSERLTHHIAQTSQGAEQYLLVINNLGGLSPLELALLCDEVLKTPLAARVSHLLGPATLVSALDMKGFSITLLALDAERLTALQAPVEVAGWSQIYPLTAAQRYTAPTLQKSQTVQPSADAAVSALIKGICQAIIDNESALNHLDSQVGDGDTGSTLTNGANYVLAALVQRKLPLADPAALLNWLGEHITQPMGGSGGVLLSLLFGAAGTACQQGEPVTAGLLAGLKQMKHYGGAELGDRTAIDALQPALEALAAAQPWQQVAQAAQQGAETTAEMSRANAGRSAYLNAQSLLGHIDPGAWAVSLAFAAAAKVLSDSENN